MNLKLCKFFGSGHSIPTALLYVKVGGELTGYFNYEMYCRCHEGMVLNFASQPVFGEIVALVGSGTLRPHHRPAEPESAFNNRQLNKPFSSYNR